jgi:hypothetical protein
MFEHLTNLFARKNETESELSLLKKKIPQQSIHAEPSVHRIEPAFS